MLLAQVTGVVMLLKPREFRGGEEDGVDGISLQPIVVGDIDDVDLPGLDKIQCGVSWLRGVITLDASQGNVFIRLQGSAPLSKDVISEKQDVVDCAPLAVEEVATFSCDGRGSPIFFLMSGSCDIFSGDGGHSPVIRLVREKMSIVTLDGTIIVSGIPEHPIRWPMIVTVRLATHFFSLSEIYKKNGILFSFLFLIPSIWDIDTGPHNLIRGRGER